MNKELNTKIWCKPRGGRKDGRETQDLIREKKEKEKDIKMVDLKMQY